MKNIKENNRLIAEFLGYPLDEKEGLHWIDTEESYGYKTSDLKYHNDWNWLMKCLKEVDNLEFELPEDSNLIGDITHGLVSLDIEMTYEAVVEFIKWYNENK